MHTDTRHGDTDIHARTHIHTHMHTHTHTHTHTHAHTRCLEHGHGTGVAFGTKHVDKVILCQRVPRAYRMCTAILASFCQSRLDFLKCQDLTPYQAAKKKKKGSSEWGHG